LALARRRPGAARRRQPPPGTRLSRDEPPPVGVDPVQQDHVLAVAPVHRVGGRRVVRRTLGGRPGGEEGRTPSAGACRRRTGCSPARVEGPVGLPVVVERARRTR
jgi:hypothetical protein